MSKLFKILEKLTERNVWYSFQSQDNGYYHLIVVNPKGVKTIQGYYNFKQLEKWLNKMWGHIIIPLPNIRR